MTQSVKRSAGLIVALFIMNAVWAQTAAFNQNASGSNRTVLSGLLNNPGQNNNTVRSNRGELSDITILGDMDGDGAFESDVTAQALNGSLPNGITVIVSDKATASISNVLKTKHDTVKNSISNMR
ncbi:MAG TPA: hypothetical protein PKE30_03925 [Niabella sp.]|nr:hypothetical protein [Niabella sp.]